MYKSTLSDKKRAQKESLFLHAVAQFFRKITLDEPSLAALALTRVKLSSDYGLCIVYFYTAGGKEAFDQILSDTLKLYKPSLRKALATELNQRRTPNLIFKFDDIFDKQMHVEQLFEKLKQES